MQAATSDSGRARHDVVVVGNGGHSRSCVDAWDPEAEWRPIGCTGLDPAEHSELPYLGTDDVISDLLAQGVRHAFIAIGANALRATIARRLESAGMSLATLVAPTARVAPSATVGEGSAVLHGAIVGAFAEIGVGAIINTGATVDHDCRIGDFAHVAPGTHLAGAVTVGPRAFLGVGVSVVPGVVIGDDAVVGAGAVVVGNVPAGATVYGIPAREPRKAPN